jgi:hypothetical protein
MMYFAKLFVIVDYWKGLVEIILNSYFYCFSIVIWSSTSFCSFHASLKHYLLRNIIKKNWVHLSNLFFKINCLVYSSWKSIYQICLWWGSYQCIYQYLDCKFKWHQPSGCYNFFNLFSFFCSFWYFLSH